MACGVTDGVDGVDVAIDDRVELDGVQHGGRITAPQEHQRPFSLCVHYLYGVGSVEGRGGEVVL